jgi:alkylation response protein AidB-like acyl-CoA dehydrogenase
MGAVQGDMDRNGEGQLPEWVTDAARFADDPLSTARSLRSVIESNASENERIGRLNDESARALCESGLLGLLIPHELGGIEADPGLYIDVIEELSYADGSFGWVTMATTFTIMGAAAWLGPVAVASMFEGKNGFVAAGQIAPNGVAERVGDGYRISGQFHFGSGSQLSSWFLGAFVLHEEGLPVRNANGAPKILWAFGPRDSVHIDAESWDVMGLRGTASHDFLFFDQVVHEDFVLSLPLERLRGGAALDIGVSMGHVSFSLGVGTRILDELRDLAKGKQREGRITLIDQANFQRDFGMMRGEMEAARAYVRSAFEAWRRDAQANGTASLETRAKARLAACWGTRVSSQVAQFAYVAAGTDGLRNDSENRLQRCYRDIGASAVHRHVDDNVLIDAATVLLGVAAPSLQL